MATLRPTFSESWYRVADLKVKLRPSAQISRQHYRGDRWYVVRDPAGNQFHRLSAPAYNFVGLLDGSRTVAEAWELVGGQLADDAPTQNEVIQILSQLHAANLLEANVTPDAAVLLKRHKKQQQRKWQGRLMNILFPRIPLWDPDRFLVRWMPVMRHLLSWWFAFVWLAVVGAAVAVVAPRWPELQAAAMNAIRPDQWPFLWATFVVIKLIHELGHGFTCRRFGGEVHELGIMFLVFVPAPYVDASSAWSFQSKWAKIFVGAGGMIFELFVASIAAFIWASTKPGQDFYGIPINGIAYNTMLIASVSTIIFNANPLLRYDGYYMLSDFLEIPNLRYRSTEYSLGLIKRHIFRVKQHQPLPPLVQRFWLLVYAISSSIYRTIIGVAIILMVWDQVPVLGVLMALGGVITWLFVPIFKTSKYLMLDPELHRKRAMATVWTVLFVAAVVGVLWGIRMPNPLYTEGMVEPAKRESIFTLTAGKVHQIHVEDGQWVKQGQEILTCRDEQLESILAQRLARLRAMQVQREASIADATQRTMLVKQIEALQKELKELNTRTDQLVVRAPIEGKLIAPNIRNLKGVYVTPGVELGIVAQSDKLRIVALVDQDDAALSFKDIGREAQVRMTSTVWRKDLRATFKKFDGTDAQHPTELVDIPMEWSGLTTQGGGKVAVNAAGQKDPRRIALERPQVAIWLDFANPGGEYLPGQRCYLRFDMQKQSWGQQWTRRVWQLIQSHTANTKWI